MIYSENKLQKHYLLYQLGGFYLTQFETQYVFVLTSDSSAAVHVEEPGRE